MDAPPLHPDLEPVAFLLGSWKGKGAGSYPDIEDFTYLEVATFTHVGKPFIAYTQRTRHAVTGEPLHAETGYLRAVSGNAAEFVVAQPSGIVEVLDVELAGTTMFMTARSVLTTPSAKRVDGVTRHLRIDDDEMHYDIQMAAMGHALQPHLEAVLNRD